MKKLIALIGLVAFTATAQTTIPLGDITVTPEQVKALTWHWENYTNALGSNYLGKVAWFKAESTNRTMQAIERMTAQYNNNRRQALIDTIATNADKRTRIEAIVNE